MKVIDNAQRPVAHCLLDPEKAYLAGKLVTDDVDSLQRFRRVFPVNPQATLAVAQSVRDEIQAKAEKDELKNEDITDVCFLKLIPALYKDEEALGWNATLAFDITDAAPYTVVVANNDVRVEKGTPVEPTATVKMDLETLTGIMNFGAMQASHNIGRVEIDDSEFLDQELDDDQLEAVAGGKGTSACGGEACAGDACNMAACGGAACGGDACNGDACGGAACGGAACSTAACVADACGGAACAAAACAGAACGADAGVGACAGDICGAAVGAGVCAGNVCGVDVLGPVDVGPCGVNVVPGIPGI